MNLPARTEGDHFSIGALVAAEAMLMLSCAPYFGAHSCGQSPIESRLLVLEEGIWRWLRSGWTRVRDDGVLVHWHPDAEDWVPFSRSLHDYYTKEFLDMRHWLIHWKEQHG